MVNLKLVELYSGQVQAGLTDHVAPDGRFTLRNSFPPDVAQIIAVVRVLDARAGQVVTGRWSQLGVIQQKAQGLTPEGAVITEAEFTVRPESIAAEDASSGGRLSLHPRAPLPVDSYLLQVFVDGMLARTLAFVVTPT